MSFWNINGRTHFLNTDYVTKWLQTNFDILFVTETHFIKGTCFSVPNFTSFHNPLCDYNDRKPHGGITCFINSSILHLIEHVDKSIPETIVVEFVGGHRVFGNYIVPVDSPYFEDVAFANVANRFSPKDSTRVIWGGGDLNARVGDIKQKLPTQCSYRKNADEYVNDSGRTLISICSSFKCFVINNMNIGSTVCDGGFTFQKGGRKSQNDIILTNKSGLLSIQKFEIHQIGWNPSDHTPISTCVELDVTNHNLSVLASQDIVDDYNCGSMKKAKKIHHGLIDWNKYKTMTEHDYAHYNEQIQLLRNEKNLTNIDTGVNLLTDSLYKCATTLTPRSIAVVEEKDNTLNDPLIDCANRFHSEWQRGEHDDAEWDSIHEEVVDHLKKNAVSKVRRSWANVLQENDSKALWQKINWKGTFESSAVTSKPPLTDLKDHFVQKGQSVEDSTLLCDVTGNQSVPELDKEIELDEIDCAINRLKEDKSSGDGWTKKMVSNLPLCLMYALHIIYNAILSSHSYPTRWRMTVVNEIFKHKGISSIAKNYRGISLVALLSKIFDLIQCNRFTKWFTPDDGQTAYQEGKSGADHVFLIRCIVQHARRFKKKLFIVAFDFDGAFDRVSRSLLIRKLIRFGAGVTFVAIVASMYMSTDNVIFRNKEYVLYKLYSGIKQGLPLSPMLFIFYINDMFDVFRKAHGWCKETLFHWIHILVHADDVTLLATDRKNAGDKLVTLCLYCNTNHIIAQTTKCKFIVINGDEDDNEDLPFGNAVIGSTDHLEILGSHITNSGLLIDDLELHMKKRYKSCIKFFNFCHENKLAPVSVRLKALRACVMQSLLYNCETFGNNLPKRLETTYNKLIRAALQVRSNTPSLILLIESGLLPIKALAEARQYKFFQRFQSSLAPISERQCVFDELRNDPSKYMKHYLSLSDSYTSHHDIYKHHLSELKSKIHDLAAKGKSKYATYVSINPNLEPSPLIQCMHPLTSDIIRFRVGSHRLPIETGRWSRRSREERLCDVCEVIGDEEHYVFNCSLIFRSDLNLENNISQIWEKPDLFRLVGRLKLAELL